MPRTPEDKYQFGIDYIDGLSSSHQCKSWSFGVTDCHCINEKKNLLDVQVFFKKEVYLFWKVEEHYASRKDAEKAGKFFGQYLYDHCSLDSKKPWFIFTIKGKEMEFCLNTLTKIFGLGRHAFRAARVILTDDKAIGINLLKKACWLDMKTNTDHRHLYRNYREVFNHMVVPMSHHNPQAIQVVKKLEGFMIELNQPSLDAIDYINEHHLPYYEDLSQVVAGGDNIRYGAPRNLPKFGSFDNHPVMSAFRDQFFPVLMDHWKNKEGIIFDYETTFILSQLGSEKDNVPQKAHTDVEDYIIEHEKKTLGIKSCIGFCPIHPDGMLLQVWIEGEHKKFHSTKEVLEDQKRVAKNVYPKPAQYMLYIPRGVLLVVPADTVHAGGMCFGSKVVCPSKSNNNDIMFQNTRLHFNFCCSKKGYDVANKVAKIVIRSDDRPKYVPDLMPDGEIMECLFKSVLDRHPNFIKKEAKK